MINIDYILSCHGYGGGSSKDKTPPPPCTGFTATGKNAQVILNWTNPVDTDFVGVKILRKTGSYPTSPTDGTIVYSGANTSYTDTTVTNGTQYYYRTFTFDYDNNFNTAETGQEATATPQAYTIYGVKIDTTNSNPSTAITYINDSTGFTPASGNNGTFSYGSWADKFPFNQIKPCTFLTASKTVNYYLDPTNYTKKADGTASIITGVNSLDGQVMVEFPKIYWKFETIGTDIYIRISDTKVDSSYKCLAHMRGTTEKDKCYIGAYLGNVYSSRLLSISGSIPTTSQTISQFRTVAQGWGSGFDQIGYFQILMLQILFLIMFKSRDSQTAFGKFYADSTNATIATTGGTNTKGMFYAPTNYNSQNKFCGIEDFLGNVRCFIDGLVTDASRNILIGNQSFNDSGTGYTNYGIGASSDKFGLMTAIQGGTETGFICKEIGGSTTTYYPNYACIQASKITYFGEGYGTSGSGVGVFSLFPNAISSSSGVTMGSRLMYL